MLQEQYEKHNLEMQHYHYYLSEYQNMDPGDISRHLEVPFDENTPLPRRSFSWTIFRQLMRRKMRPISEMWCWTI